MTHITEIVNQVLPVLFLLLLGNWIRRREFLSASVIDGLRAMVVNLALPAVLFLSFVEIELKLAYLVLFALIFGLCIALYGLGVLLKRAFHIDHPYFPFLITGFEYGMLGISLFGSAYGLDQIGHIAVLALGHETFIWFVFLALLLMRRDGIQSPRKLVGQFFRSPVIVAILTGMTLNLLGAQASLSTLPVVGALTSTLELLGNLTIPIILIIVGYGIRFDREGAQEALVVVAIRLTLLIPLALALNALVIRRLLGLEWLFEAALFTLLILPPPFIVPLYMRQGLDDEQRYVNNVLMLHAVISIAIYAVYFALNAWR